MGASPGQPQRAENTTSWGLLISPTYVAEVLGLPLHKLEQVGDQVRPTWSDLPKGEGRLGKVEKAVGMLGKDEKGGERWAKGEKGGGRLRKVEWGSVRNVGGLWRKDEKG